MKNQQMQTLVAELRKASSEQSLPLWRRVADDLAKPARRQRAVNLSRIERYAKDKDVIVVPGKVLGDGDLTKKVTIAAHTFSASALAKIAKSGSKAYPLAEFMKANPKPKNAKLLG